MSEKFVLGEIILVRGAVSHEAEEGWRASTHHVPCSLERFSPLLHVRIRTAYGLNRVTGSGSRFSTEEAETVSKAGIFLNLGAIWRLEAIKYSLLNSLMDDPIP